MNILRALALCLALVSCKTITSPPVVQVATDCGSPALRDLAVHLLDDVTSAVLSGAGWEGAVAAVAARAGADGLAAVKCAIAEIIGQTSTQLAAKAAMDPAEAQRTQLLHDRAVQWQATHP